MRKDTYPEPPEPKRSPCRNTKRCATIWPTRFNQLGLFIMRGLLLPLGLIALAVVGFTSPYTVGVGYIIPVFLVCLGIFLIYRKFSRRRLF